MKYLVVGLGNIGVEYELTRHNIGFLILDRIADLNQVNFEQGRLGFRAEWKYRGRSLVLIKPTTYMNLSGKAVNYWLQQVKVPLEKLIVVTDDIALPFGKIRLKGKGSSGGHNGLKNTEQMLGRSDYARLRFGVGDDFRKGGQVDYVLSPFTSQELDGLVPLMDRSADVIKAFATIGLQRAMNNFN